MTDEAGQYSRIDKNFSEHGIVVHSKGEYVSMKDRTVHTNCCEGFFSIFREACRAFISTAPKSTYIAILLSLISG